MKSILFIFLIAVPSLNAQSKVEDRYSEPRNVTEFHGIEAAHGIEVLLTQSPLEKVSVRSDDPEYKDEIVTSVQNGILKIYRRDSWKFWDSRRNTKVKVHISYTNIDLLESTTGASISGKIDGKLLRLTLRTGGKINLEGTVEKLIISATTGAELSGYDLIINYLEADVSTGGGVKVTVNKEVDAEAGTGGFVLFNGKAILQRHSKSTGGIIKRSLN